MHFRRMKSHKGWYLYLVEFSKIWGKFYIGARFADVE